MAEILVVDDVETVRLAIKNALESQNHIVSLAENGEEAIEVLERLTFDLIITDILMPHSDGIDLIRHIREKSKRETPVIAMTGGGPAASYDDIFKVTQAYTPIMLEKPFSKDKLLEVVHAALSNLAVHSEQ